MKFYVTRSPVTTPADIGASLPCALLHAENWNDFGYETTFAVTLFLSPTEVRSLGDVKIIEHGMGQANGNWKTTLPDDFQDLDIRFASLGQTLVYYRKLSSVARPIRDAYLTGLRDLVHFPKLIDEFHAEPAFQKSCLRYSEAEKALFEGRDILIGKEAAGEIRFDFRTRLPGAANDHRLAIDFTGPPGLPNRLHVLVGRNGTGKTQLMARLALALTDIRVENVGGFLEGRPRVSRVVAISYNPFDEFRRPKPTTDMELESLLVSRRVSYRYCGLRGTEGIRTPRGLFDELTAILDAPEFTQYRPEMVKVLGKIMESADADKFVTDSHFRAEYFEVLSAGQRIASVVFANLLAFIEKDSLVLFDEPENHLHPGLLSTLVAILQTMLEQRRSYAIVATHSPLVLQQVPSRHITLLTRFGDHPGTRPIALESLGENADELMERVLGLAEPETDYHDVLRDLTRHGSYDDVLKLFGDRLGIRARLYLRSCYKK